MRLLMSLAFCLLSLPAHAFECGTRNLIEDLRETNPKAYSRVVKEAQGMPNGEAILWRIEREDIAEPSYLFGTMHVADPRITTLSEATLEALSQSRIGIFELPTSLAESQPEVMRLMGSNLELFMAEESKGMDAELTESEKAAFSEALASKGMPLAMIRGLKPWFGAILISLPNCAAPDQMAGDIVLDDFLRLHFTENGKQTKGLETALDQLRAMDSIDYEEQVQWLKASIALLQEAENLYFTMVSAYQERQLTKLMALSRELAALEGVSFETRGFQAELLDRRNHHMLTESLAELENGGAFIGVGALHLPGNDGLVALYREAGFTVTPVE